MIDRLIYRFCGFLDNSIAFVETGVIKMVEWCWHTRVKLLNKKRKILKELTSMRKIMEQT